jgi:hypothetical protein
MLFTVAAACSRGDRAAMCRPRDDNERGQKTNKIAGGALRLKGSNPFPGAHFSYRAYVLKAIYPSRNPMLETTNNVWKL